MQAAGVSVIATKGPSLDMSTAYGRAMAGLLGEFDTMEVEVKAERQQLAYAAQRDAGIRHGGPPPFGSTAAERDAIRWAADALIGGSRSPPSPASGRRAGCGRRKRRSGRCSAMRGSATA